MRKLGLQNVNITCILTEIKYNIIHKGFKINPYMFLKSNIILYKLPFSNTSGSVNYANYKGPL